jgi:hypothetical protein
MQQAVANAVVQNTPSRRHPGGKFPGRAASSFSLWRSAASDPVLPCALPDGLGRRCSPGPTSLVGWERKRRAGKDVLPGPGPHRSRGLGGAGGAARLPAAPGSPCCWRRAGWPGGRGPALDEGTAHCYNLARDPEGGAG